MEVSGEELLQPIIPRRCYVVGPLTRPLNESQEHDQKPPKPVVIAQRDNRAMSSDKGDNNADKKAIQLKQIVVHADPKTGKKYIIKDGTKMELVVTSQPPKQMLVETTAPPPPLYTQPLHSQPPRKRLLIKRAMDQKPLDLAQPPGLVCTTTGASAFRVLHKYHATPIKEVPVVKRPAPPSYPAPPVRVVKDSAAQTTRRLVKDSFTQTDVGEVPAALTADAFFQFILGESELEPTVEQQPCAMEKKNPHQILREAHHSKQAKNVEEVSKYNFFTDMRKALVFEPSGNLPIHESVIENDVKSVRKNAIVLKAIRQSVNLTNETFYTPLHLAVINGVDVEIVNVLLTEGADINATDAEGNTAIHLAVEHKRRNILEILLNVVARLHISLETFNYDGFTPLHLAVLHCSFDDCRQLLRFGAQPNARDLKSGRTALFHACELKHVRLVKLLMTHGADTKKCNFFGTSPHEAMFEIEDMPVEIKLMILGRDHVKLTKRKLDEMQAEQHQHKEQCEGAKSKRGESVIKKPVKALKMEVQPVLKKLTASEMAVSAGS